jgi:phage terminase small subunit
MSDEVHDRNTFIDLAAEQLPKPRIGGSMRRKNAEGLTPIQAAFVLEYLVDLNQTAAAIRAGASPATASAIAAAWMKTGGKVANAVARAMAERSARVGISQDRVLQELGRLAFGDPRVMFREDGSLKAPTEYNSDDGAMIEGIKTRRIVEVAIDPETGKQRMVPVEIQEVKLVSKMGPLNSLMRHLGMNNDKLDINFTSSLADRLNEAYRRTGRARPSEGDEAAALAAVPDAEYEMVDENEAHEGQPRLIEGEAEPDHPSLDDMLR